MRATTIFLTLFLFSRVLQAAVIVDIYSTKSDHQKIGNIIFKDKKRGMMVFTNLAGLAPGEHGFHIHENASCDDVGMAAGGHYDPSKTKSHLGPYHHGHQGDLPKLIVEKNSISHQALFAPHLSEKDVYGHAVMIHAGGDNYADQPKPLGGGGDRIACGVAKSQVI